MGKKRIDTNKVKAQYNELYPKYERMAQLLQQVIRDFLRDAQIDVLDVTYRVKEVYSFLDKIERKNYSSPFSEIQDFCGLRIICFYTSDLEAISQIINREFIVTESIDKADLLELDRFGYRSLHFIVNFREEWLGAPQYRGLGDLKAEIQVRTILMHAWANLSHKLAYKKKEQVPDQFHRSLYQLSALFEMADDQFDSLQKGKAAYQEQLASEASKTSEFDKTQPLNIDSLQAYLDFYFPSRQQSATETERLLDEFLKSEISVGDLVDGYEKTSKLIHQIEKDLTGKDGVIWSQVGAARAIMDVSHKGYWSKRKQSLPEDWIPVREKWSNKLRKS